MKVFGIVDWVVAKCTARNTGPQHTNFYSLLTANRFTRIFFNTDQFREMYFAVKPMPENQRFCAIWPNGSKSNLCQRTTQIVGMTWGGTAST